MTFCVITALFTCGVGAGAKSQTIPAPSAPTPIAPALFDVLGENPRAQLFSSVLGASGLSRADIHETYLTIVVPRDDMCSGRERISLESLKDSKAAKAYVLDHAFAGQLAIYREGGKLISVNYFPDANDMRGKVAINESHPFNMPLLSGKSVLISVRGQEILMGQKAALVEDYGAQGGAVVELDHCAIY
jgi:hypothetical protein